MEHFIIAFILSLVLTKFIIKKMINVKYGIDLHKGKKIKVAEMGGFAPLITNTVVLPFFNPYILVIVVLSGIIGIIDDIAKLSPKEKLIFLGISALPVGILLNMNIFHLFLLMLGVSIASNLTNMLAGFNGLEIGVGIISSIFLGLCLLTIGDLNGFQLVIIFVMSYLGLFIFNKYPAKVFPGDVGTLPIGAFLATMAIWKGIILPFLIIMMPYILDAGLKFYSAGVTRREEHKPTVLKNGKLYVEGGYLSLPRIILKKKPMKEYEIVLIIWGISIFFGVLGLITTKILYY
ncbi:MraY family glycosyltransferase [Methanotorris formicicus]|uniref:Glycosyl transferase, family 4, conserved region n=1 Tax=Methanotorris formicicus Mc-S-70 TaxID=647171 RepID=H1KW55_9EURY|nr:glycosyltransferase 4 family protein [Methanotorris formicicus]EHP89638.1 Glycosyl transferase, family 4, conserved region [Methanotorris formicicus Mc-S-70]